ncbi:hypothetical protein [Deinococcus pimensis]|uniref:hypothetical protein n=1 Tax=Deinococcus pimensis TaxID=309888 RepID=UPI0005EB2023|nr:hypothetical protein [Deinococcus pimensis]
MIELWTRTTASVYLADELGGTWTGGGQTMDRRCWDTCAEFKLPDGQVLDVMLSMDDDVASVRLWDHPSSEEPVLCFEGEPAEVRNALVAKLFELGYRKPGMRA